MADSALDASSLKLRAVYTTGEFAFVSCSCGVFVRDLWLKTEMLAGRGPWYLLVRGDLGEKMAAAPETGVWNGGSTPQDAKALGP